MRRGWMIIALALLACGEKKPTTPWVNVCPDVGWLDTVKATITQNGWKGEIYLSTYNSERVFEVHGCVTCPDFISQLQNCEGDTLCQMGGIAALTCAGYAPDADDRLLYWKN